MVEASSVGSLRIEPAAPADFPRIAELTAGVYRDEGLAPEEYQRELRDVAGRASRAELLVARDGDAVAFRMLVVDPAERGRGVGELFVRECLDRARASGKRLMVLSTDPRMRAAHRLYERLGFTRLPERDCGRTPLPPTARTLAAGPCSGAIRPARRWRSGRPPGAPRPR